jgi:hypothetical protein
MNYFVQCSKPRPCICEESSASTQQNIKQKQYDSLLLVDFADLANFVEKWKNFEAN